LSASPFGGTSINAAGQVAYCGYLADGASGIFVGPDGVTNLAQTGSGSQFSSPVTFPKIGDSGDVVFWAELTNYSTGDFLSTNGVVTQIAVAGGGQPDDQFPSVNAAGTVACHGRLPSGERAVLAGNNAVVDKVIAEGDSLFGSTVIGLGAPGNNGLNNGGQIVFSYSLANGVEGIAVATPTNGSTQVSPKILIQQPDPLHITLIWPTNAAGFSLQHTTDITRSFSAVTNEPVMDGTNYLVIMPCVCPAEFFCLKSGQ
jgi:hypothetical protein